MQHLAMFKWHVSWARTDMNLTGGLGGGKVIHYVLGKRRRKYTELAEQCSELRSTGELT